MNGNIRIGSLFGIPFFVNLSWFLVLGLVTLTYSNGLSSQFPWLAAGVPLLLGLVTALLLFASVLAHELGHSFVAMRQGIEVRSITLFLFGGLANLEKESKTPAGAFWVAIAGPLVSFMLFGILTFLAVSTPVTGPFAAILGVLASVNLALGLFNLIPGLPLDGGNILKAAVWKLTGNPYKGVKFASWVGQIFGWVAIASGLLPLVFAGNSSNLWNLLVGWFLLQNASQAAQFATVREQLVGLTAADAVTQNSPVVASSLSLREFADRTILNPDNWKKFLVTNDEGRLVGTISVDVLNSIPRDRWLETSVAEVAKPIEISSTVSSEKTLIEAIELLETKQLSALAVIRENGVLVGLLEKAKIIAKIQNRVAANPA